MTAYQIWDLVFKFGQVWMLWAIALQLRLWRNEK